MAAHQNRGRLWALATAAVLALALAPVAIAGGIGRMLGGLWVSTMGAVVELVGAMLGGG